MVKDKRKIGKFFIIVILLLLSYCSILSYFIINTNNKIKLENDIKIKNIDVLDELKNNLKILDEEEITLLNEIDRLNNIDEYAKTIKNEVFELTSKLENNIKSGDNSLKIAYLTFDDGPYYLTNSFLDILDKYEVKATFFTIGYDKDLCFDNRSMDCSNMYKKIVEKGHTIANHTFSHSIFNGLYSSSNAFIDDLKYQENFIKDRTGVITNIMRFPGGSNQAKSLKNDIINKLRENNYGWVDWTALNGDGGYVTNKEVAFNNFKQSINEDIEVVLFHDYNYATLAMLEDAIKYLMDNNYILLPLFYDSVMVNK